MDLTYSLAFVLVVVAAYAAAFVIGERRTRWNARAAVLRQATAEYRRETAAPLTPRALVAELTTQLARAAVEVHLAGGEGRGWLLRDVGHAWDRELAKAVERNDRLAAEWETRQ